MNLRRIPMVEVTGLEPAASWSQTTRATNCATPRSYNLSIIIHKRCGRQVRRGKKSYSQAEQPPAPAGARGRRHRRTTCKTCAAGGAPAVVQVQDHKRGDKDRHSAADGLPHLPAAQPGHAAVEQRRRAERGFLPRSVPPAQANSSVNTGASSAQSQNSDAQISSTMQTPRSTRS